MQQAEPSTDQILAEVQGDAEQPQVETQEPVEQQQAPIQEFEYSANGKTIKEPIDAILKRASQGYNYAQHMADLKKKSEEVDTRYNHALELEKKYGEIDKYAQENPEWNDHLHKTWDSRFDITGENQGTPSQQQTAQIPAQFQEEFNAMKQFVDNIKAERADAAYNGAVQQVRDKYPDIDFAATDPNTGKTLEQQVLDYAEQQSIGKFEPAFKAYYHDQLVERARNQAKEQMAGDIKQRAKAGLLGTSQAPTAPTEMGYPPNWGSMSDSEQQNWIIGQYT